MRITALPTLVALALLGPAVQLAADGPAPPAVGARVRVTAPGMNAERLVGTLEGLSSDSLSLRLRDARAPLLVPREAVTKLEVSRGRRTIGKGALIGAGIGAAVGAVWYNTCDRHGDDCASTRQNLQTGALLGAPFGAAIGALVAVVGGERWQPVAPERLRVSLAPARRQGVAFSVSFGF